MTRAAILTLCIGFLFSVSSGCSDATGLSPRDLERIGGGVSFGIIETYRFHESETGEPELALYLETEGPFGCVNYSMELDLEVDGQDVFITLFGVEEPDVCLTAIGPAIAVLPLSLSEGDVSLHFSFAGETDHFQASISDLSIDIDPEGGEFTRRQEERLWRYPEQSFALVCDVEAWGEEDCAGLKSLLLAEIDLSEISFSEEGKNPYPTDATQDGRHWRASYFQLAEEEDFSLVRQALCSFASSLPDPGASQLTGAYLLNWKNEGAYSWVSSDCPSVSGAL